MAGLDPAIHGFDPVRQFEDVDARIKSGHDEPLIVGGGIRSPTGRPGGIAP
jgi:hypothetical protein